MTTSNGSHDHEACVKLLTDTMARLDEISESHMQGILDIAIAAADAANSLAPGSTDADAFVDKVKALIDSMRSKAESLGGEMIGGGTENTSAAGGEMIGGGLENSSTAGSDKFCASVERDINMAIENGLSLQQQLNVTGVAVLSEGAALILESARPVGGTGSIQ
jgi:hypothetical protein